MAKKAFSLTPAYMVQAHEALRRAIAALQAAHVETASLDARLLLQHVLGISHEEWVAEPEKAMTAQQAEAYDALIARRARHEPVAHLMGTREFWSMDFRVTPATLVPRPDSETVIEAVLQRIADRNAPLSILDLGTGTGCLLLSLLKELPNAQGTGIDLSREALTVAQENALQLGLAARAHFNQGNWCDESQGRFDVIVSNPPYIPTANIASLDAEVEQYEPRLALDGGADGLDCYRDILAALPDILKPDGIAAFEVGIGQSQAVTELAREKGFQLESIRKDMQGICRCVLVKHLTKEQ